SRLDLEDDVVAFGGDAIGLGDVWALDPLGGDRFLLGVEQSRPGLDADLEAARPQPPGIRPGLPRPQVELPAVPLACDDLARAAVLKLAGPGRFERAPQLALAQRPALVRAAVAQREELPIHVEDADGNPRHIDDLPLARRDLVDGGDYISRHCFASVARK